VDSPTGRYADLGDMLVHYRDVGDADDVVVLLHGVPQTSHEWRHVIPRLAPRYRVIAPDLRGLGDTSRPPSGYDKKTVAADVWRLVHEHLGIDRFFLVGHDWGGPTAFALACAHPDAVRRLAGDQMLDDLSGFFDLVRGLADGLRRRADEVGQLIRSPSTRFMLTLSARAPQSDEVEDFLVALRAERIQFGGFLINRWESLSFQLPAADPTAPSDAAPSAIG
jgi:pimeloyl-ACP methyl ester carboxylesterase